MSSDKYRPINCSLHDYLLDRASKKANVRLEFKSESETETYTGRILDIFSTNGEEYLKGEDNFLIRLDRIRRMDDISFGE